MSMTGTATETDFWKERLNGARLIVAPMVDQSELPWRLLSRRYGAQLCYTPMFHAALFGRDQKYRSTVFTTCQEDRPLIVQFCANDAETLLRAARLVEKQCDAVDLNLGCPQGIAKRGHYGSFLQDEWALLRDMVTLCARELSIPITAKIRVFDDIQKTVEYAQMLEKAGCKDDLYAQLLTVHGRTREQKGSKTGLASWAHIKAVKESVSIPVFANGNIQTLGDVLRCIEETGVEGVMSAEGNLHNPALFKGLSLPAWTLAQEYIGLVTLYPCPISSVRAHLFKLMHHVLHVHKAERAALGTASSLPEMCHIVSQVAALSEGDIQFYKKEYQHTEPPGDKLPYWICQPYVRPSETATKSEIRECCWNRCKTADDATVVIVADDATVTREGQPLSKNKQKKLRKTNSVRKSVQSERKAARLCLCGDSKGLKCEFSLCRPCCRTRSSDHLNSDCPAHKRSRSSAFKPPEADTDTNEKDTSLTTEDTVTPAVSDR